MDYFRNFCYTAFMFNSLTGIITGKFPNTVYLDTYGIEWDIYVPDSTLDSLPPVGQTGRVYTWMYHREDMMRLYGFASVKERNLFLDLLKVDGVGAKGAVKILSNIAGAQLSDALDTGDIAALEKVPGVGKKTAAKMMLALKGKLTLDDGTSTGGLHPVKMNEFADVITSLSNMGYDRRDCEQTVDRLASSFASDTDFCTKSREDKEEALFRRALVELAQ